MGMYRDESGMLIEVDDRFAEARGYVPADPAEFGALIGAAGEAERSEQRGVAGTVGAFGNRFSSALTLGTTDVLLGETLTPLERERVLADIEAHPYAATAGEIAGTFAGATAVPGGAFARTPAGYLGSAASRGVESSLAQGGIAGTAKALNVMGLEGAAQGAGQYIGHAALADKEVTVEGLAGSLGTGYGFGAVGGGAALGVVKGTMAARRLYSRVMDGRQAAQAAESSWKLSAQEALDADTATLRAAEIKLDQIRTAKTEAMRYRNEAKAAAAEERIRSAGMTERAGPDGETAVSQTSSAQAFEGPEPLIDVDAIPVRKQEGATRGFQRTMPDDPAAFDASLPSNRDAVQDIADGIAQPDGAKTGAFKAPPGSTQKIVRGEAPEPQVFYHGTSSEISSLSEGGSYSTDQNVYGGGFYTTSDAEIAKSYMRKGAKKAGPGARANVYRIEEVGPVRFYDMDAPLPASLKKELERVAESSESAADALEGSTTLAEFFDNMRGVSREYGESAATIQDAFEQIKSALRKEGYGGFTHVGGKLTGGKPHQVKIYWEPQQQVKISRGGEAPEPKPGQTYAGRDTEIHAKIKEMQRQGRTKEGMAEAARGATDRKAVIKRPDPALPFSMAEFKAAVMAGDSEAVERLARDVYLKWTDITEGRLAVEDIVTMRSRLKKMADAADQMRLGREFDVEFAGRELDWSDISDVDALQHGIQRIDDGLRAAVDQAEKFIAAKSARGAVDLGADRMAALSDIRYKATEDLLGPQAAKMERELQEIVDEYNQARAGLGELSDGIPEALDEVAIRKQLDVPSEAPARGGKTTPGKRQARQILDDAHEEALLRAKYGSDPREAGKAISEAEELENLLAQIDDVSDGVPRMVDGTPEEMFADQLAADIKKIWRYEEASAKLSDAIGEASHPTSLAKAKGLRDATKDAERKMLDRTAREVDDAAEFGPTYKSPKERVAYARERLVDAQKNVDELGVQEREARQAVEGAGKQVRLGQKAKKDALRADKEAATAATRIGAQDIGGIMEIIDLPGLPKPSDLPVVGPLLGAWLKFRTLKKALGRAMGRVPATADAKVAARANQTRDRIARAVDRSLGLMERGGKYAMRRMPQTAGILSARIYNDGGEDPGPKASIQKQAAARMREISAYVHTPNAIELDVRRELRGVTDPDLIAAAEKHRRFMMEYILRHMPKVPDQGLLKTHDWEPSAGQAMSLARRLEAANEPAAVFEKLAQERDLVSLEAAETLRDVYPKLFQEALRRATQRAAEAPERIPYRTRVQMTVFYRQPFEAALSPENFQITQSVYERKPSSPAYNPAAPGAAPAAPPTAQPSIANPTNLAEEYMPSFDRR